MVGVLAFGPFAHYTKFTGPSSPSSSTTQRRRETNVNTGHHHYHHQRDHSKTAGSIPWYKRAWPPRSVFVGNGPILPLVVSDDEYVCEQVREPIREPICEPVNGGSIAVAETLVQPFRYEEEDSTYQGISH